jgi:hypothetical protein
MQNSVTREKGEERMEQVLTITNPLQSTVKGYAEFIHQIPWSHYCKLTFKDLIAPGAAWHAFDDWKKEMSQLENRKIQYPMARDVPEWRCHPHYHILLYNTEGVPMYKYQQRWFQTKGWANISPYFPTGGIGHYLGSKMAKGISEVKFSYGLEGIINKNN